jgi:hypothetical protein
MRLALCTALLLIIGCGSGCQMGEKKPPYTIKYEPYSGEMYSGKDPNWVILTEPLFLNHRQYTKIGRLSITGATAIRHVQAEFDQAVAAFYQNAKIHGADGIVGGQVQKGGYVYNNYVPGHTTFYPSTTYQSGAIYGGRPAYYSGTSTTNVPVYHPGYVDQEFIGTYSIVGELIVLLDKDTSGYVGVVIDQMATNIEGCRISAVVPGSTAAQGGLMVGDVIVKIDGELFRDGASFYRRTAVVGTPIRIGYVRNGKEAEAVVMAQQLNYGQTLPVSTESQTRTLSQPQDMSGPLPSRNLTQPCP